MEALAYLDTSILVKLYVQEPDSQRVAELVEETKAAATSLVACAEARAAFARLHREGAFSPEEYDRLVSAFRKDWVEYLMVYPTQEVVFRAGALAEKHGLRGFHAIHLASALTLRDELSRRIVFSSADRKLQEASTAEGLEAY